MAQVESEEKHREHVKAGDEPALEAPDHHRVNVVMIERIERESVEARIGRADGEMEDVIDDEGEEHEPAQDHAAGGKCRFDCLPALVTLGPRPAVLDREPDGVVNVKEDDDQEPAADDPEEHPEPAQFFGVTVDPLRAEENLEVAEEMADDEKNQDEPGHRHDHFPADR